METCKRTLSDYFDLMERVNLVLNEVGNWPKPVLFHHLVQDKTMINLLVYYRVVVYGALGRQKWRCHKHGISFVLPLNAPKIKFHYWWTLFIDGYVRLNPLQKLVRKEQSEKINPRTNLMEYADMKSLLNLSQVWFNQQSFLCIIKHSICSIKCICIQIKLAKLNYFPNLCKEGFSVANTRDILIHLYSYTCSMCLVLRGNVTHYKLWDNIKDENLDELQWPER